MIASEEQETSLSVCIGAAGARDGITYACDGSVDGMPLAIHLALLADIRAVFNTALGL